MRKKLAMKICAIAMTAAMVGTMAGCGNDSGSGSSGAGSSTSESSSDAGSDAGSRSQGGQMKAPKNLLLRAKRMAARLQTVRPMISAELLSGLTVVCGAT